MVTPSPEPPFSPQSYEISITLRDVGLPVDEELVKRVISTVLAENARKSGRVSVVFVTDAEIHEINRQFLGHDYPTDVISFSLSEEGPDAANNGDSQGFGAVGIDAELIISVDTATEVAIEVGWSPACELLLYCVHGALHLCGYEDDTPAEMAQMRKAEREIFRLCELPEPPPTPYAPA
jgi:probable rRNA maturation factor